MTIPISAGRNILVFADGTANEGGLLPDEVRTNVYKLYRATRIGPDTSIDPERQLAFYVSGIGTPTPGNAPTWRLKMHEMVDQALGIGLADKIVEAYVAIVGSWRPGDRISLFGFSRGAYTVRCLAHVLENMGIPTRQADGSEISLDPHDLYPLAVEAVKILYRHGVTTKDDAERDVECAAFRAKHASCCAPDHVTVPYFMGVWDTVAAEGWSRLFPGHDEMHLPKGLGYVRHAMAIDEYRKDFARVGWGSTHTIRQREGDEPEPFEQLWFAGCHADIGGGYPENESRLSDIALDWIVDFATTGLPEGTRIDVDRRYLNLHPSCTGMMHDECMAGKVPWFQTVRPVAPEGTLHPTVLERLALPAVRNFKTYGPYRPANLEKHPQAAQFFAA